MHDPNVLCLNCPSWPDEYQLPRSKFRAGKRTKQAGASIPISAFLRQPLDSGRQRQPADALARCCEESVRNRRRDRRHGGLTDTAWLRVRGQYVYLDPRHFIHPKDRIVSEAVLPNAATLERDLLVKRGGHAHGDAPFDLRANDVGIHDHAAVDRAHDTIDFECSRLLDGNLRDLRYEAVEWINRDPTTAACGQRLIPSRFFADQVHDPALLRIEQCAAELAGIGAGGVRQFVHETFDRKRVTTLRDLFCDPRPLHRMAGISRQPLDGRDRLDEEHENRRTPEDVPLKILDELALALSKQV